MNEREPGGDPSAFGWSEHQDRVGQSIGRYRILDVLGEGGFGIVYLAEQTEPVRRRVALKMVLLGMDTRSVVARFEAERQALAMMDHPNVARALDAGATDTGRPYFVMEYVAGEPVTDYCDRHRLDIRARLDLFTQICDAIQHAHQKGIIHRDVKPSNVLVTARDARPRVKVIDFGVAKAMSRPLTDKTLVTEQGQPIGTPEYMSPEQAEMTAVDVDTRSDVYALGVLLYELLSGLRPFASRTLRRAGRAEVQRIIREVDPPRPSTRVHQALTGTGSGPRPADAPTGDAPAQEQKQEQEQEQEQETTIDEIARHRGVEPGSLRRILRGDLDWITMKALEKDRTRRYQSALDLARDVQRFLRREPIEARPPSVLYQARMFARRNHRLLGAAGVVAVVIAVAFVLLVVERARAVRAEAQAKSHLERVRETERVLIEVNTFLQHDLLGANDPYRSRGRELTVSQVLDDAAAHIADRFAERPAVEASLRWTIGDAYRNIGRFEEAQVHLRRSAELHRELYGPETTEHAAVLESLAFALYRDGEHDEALELAERVLRTRQRRLPTDDPDLVRSRGDVARFRATIRGAPAADIDDPLILAMVAIGRGRGETPEQARAHVEQLVEAVEAGWAAGEHERVMELLDDEFAPFLASARTRDRVPLVAGGYALLLEQKGFHHAAEAVARSGMRIGLREFGERTPGSVYPTGCLGKILYLQGRVEEALPHCEKAARLAWDVVKPTHPEAREAFFNLADVYVALGRHDDAESELSRLHQVLVEQRGAAHRSSAMAAVALGRVREAAGRQAEAIETYRSTLAALRDEHGDDHGLTADVGIALARAHLGAGDDREAESVARGFTDDERAVALLSEIVDARGAE